MKKYFIASVLILLFSTTFALTIQNKNPIHVTIADFGQTPSDYHYCLEVYVGYDLESGCGVPVRLGPDFINNYLIGIDGDPSYYIKFAYSKAQPNAYWPSDDSKTCQFPLNSNATLTVNIEKDECTITQSH